MAPFLAHPVGCRINISILAHTAMKNCLISHHKNYRKGCPIVYIMCHTVDWVCNFCCYAFFELEVMLRLEVEFSRGLVVPDRALERQNYQCVGQIITERKYKTTSRHGVFDTKHM